MTKVAVDVQYDESRDVGVAAAVVFDDWRDASPRQEHIAEHEGLAAYVPGRFYERELPCVLPLLSALEAEQVEVVVVDGYVDLGPEHPGLGRHLYDALGGDIAIVGVAKSRFAGVDAACVLRGDSARPLWVTATFDASVAAKLVQQMHGDFRIPTMLRRVDRLARSYVRPAA